MKDDQAETIHLASMWNFWYWFIYINTPSGLSSTRLYLSFLLQRRESLLLFSSRSFRVTSLRRKEAWVTSDPCWLCPRRRPGLKRGVWAAAGVCGGSVGSVGCVGEGTGHIEDGGSQQDRVSAASTEPPACSYTGSSERWAEPEYMYRYITKTNKKNRLHSIRSCCLMLKKENDAWMHH